MIDAAEQSIDAQYFIVKKDRAGALFSLALLRAADRGVRVRLLVDDIFSPGVDEAFTLLNSHPKIEVRLFNPLPRQGFKYLNLLADFKRANRRMHNKSFTVDNSMTIVGGRNIGEEYFEINQDVKFDDYEVFAIGPVVEQVSEGFDSFWNSELSVDMDAFQIRVDPDKLDLWRKEITSTEESELHGLYATAINSSFLNDFREGRRQLAVASATMVTDSPDKLLGAIGDRDQATLAVELGRRFRQAQQEIIIVTPYYIPQEYGAVLIEELLARGIRVIIITNSLASTNHVPVHSGYARYRKRLLEAGAEFYEMRPDSIIDSNQWGHTPESVTLHSKATIIDRETIFIGSLNFDPRSILINTEMGLFIESAVIGEEFSASILRELVNGTYKVELDDANKLSWRYGSAEQQTTLHKEPLASWWRRVQVGFYRMLPIEGQL